VTRWEQILPQQILRHLYGIDDYAIGTHEAERAPNPDILGRADSLVVDPLDFNVYAITRGETRVEDWAKSDHTAIKAGGCRLDPRLWNPERALC
jgi:hypothetical protein